MPGKFLNCRRMVVALQEGSQLTPCVNFFMKFPRISRTAFVFLIGCILCASADLAMAAGATPRGTGEPPDFPTAVDAYPDSPDASLMEILKGRAAYDSFNVVGTVIFLLAIVHTFMTSTFMSISHKYAHRFHEMEAEELHGRGGRWVSAKRDMLQFKMTLFHFLGEVEAVFGIWLVPLGIAIVSMKGFHSLFDYTDHVKFTEPIFVVVIMAMASSRPVLWFAEWILSKVAVLGRHTTAAWWLSILTVGPLLGSFITEPAAMTICAMLLVSRFYKLKPSYALRYATLGLLFVNISVGGTLDHFAAPPVVMVASKWDWGFVFMFTHFGWKAVIGILVANALVFFVFRKELLSMALPEPEADSNGHRPVPLWLVVAHCAFIGWIVFVSHHASVVVLSFLFYLAFVQATERLQDTVRLRSPLLVGFFLGALVIHGGLQAWWIQPVLSSLGEWPLFFGATVLTAFNDNAAITYLASLVPGFSDTMKYAVVAGAVTGGGLTVIANAPNPAGQSILQSHFGPNGVSPGKLFLAAIVPTIVMGAAFMLLP